MMVEAVPKDNKKRDAADRHRSDSDDHTDVYEAEAVADTIHVEELVKGRDDGDVSPADNTRVAVNGMHSIS